MTYLYTYPDTGPDDWWWHECQRLGDWVTVWRNWQLPQRDGNVLNAVETRLCPFCQLRGVVGRHRTVGMGGVIDNWSEALVFDGVAWRVNGPYGRPISW